MGLHPVHARLCLEHHLVLQHCKLPQNSGLESRIGPVEHLLTGKDQAAVALQKLPTVTAKGHPACISKPSAARDRALWGLVVVLSCWLWQAAAVVAAKAGSPCQPVHLLGGHADLQPGLGHPTPQGKCTNPALPCHLWMPAAKHAPLSEKTCRLAEEVYRAIRSTNP